MLSPTRIGTWAQKIAEACLLEAGWEVFANICEAGPIDLIVISPTGETRRIDVKTISVTEWDT